MEDREDWLPDEEETNSGDDLYEHHRIVCDKGQTQIRIDKFLMDRLMRISRNKVQNACHAGAVLVNDKPIKPNYKVRPLDVITIVLAHPPSTSGVVAEEIPLDIRYEDDDIIVLYKQPGLVVHPGLGVKSGTLVNGIAHYLQNKQLPVMEGNEPDRPGLVHRIDKDTSGLMVMAKNDYAMTFMAKQFFDHSIKRTYQALIWGQPDEAEATITGNLGRNPKNRMQMTVFPDGDEGKHAVTHYKILEAMYYVSLVECTLETGRTHQIRAHMKYLGHPLFSDARYGGDDIVKGTVFTKYKQFVQNCFKIMPRQALHAKSLGFVHPTTKQEMFFDTELPEDFRQLLDKWRNYLNSRKQLMDEA